MHYTQKYSELSGLLLTTKSIYKFQKLHIYACCCWRLDVDSTLQLPNNLLFHRYTNAIQCIQRMCIYFISSFHVVGIHVYAFEMQKNSNTGLADQLFLFFKFAFCWCCIRKGLRQLRLETSVQNVESLKDTPCVPM